MSFVKELFIEPDVIRSPYVFITVEYAGELKLEDDNYQFVIKYSTTDKVTIPFYYYTEKIFSYQESMRM